ncbi:hypothetical protein [Companilactobacillus furfuricola]|uniref:hypothetical protein n=1 Tax=Companilactobacillus furfuricola TaxID=1462575 RepID=UPI000F7AE279|nr:hypothetical protein [Companilactobacillus furfuricola]
MFDVSISQDVLDTLPKKRFDNDIATISDKLSNNLENDFFRIKPVRGIKDESIYEMRIHLGGKNYRMAFRLADHSAVVIYLSTHLEKQVFDKEVQRVLRKGSRRLNSKDF